MKSLGIWWAKKTSLLPPNPDVETNPKCKGSSQRMHLAKLMLEQSYRSEILKHASLKKSTPVTINHILDLFRLLI